MTFLEHCKQYVEARKSLDDIKATLNENLTPKELKQAQTSAKNLDKVLSDAIRDIYKTLQDAPEADREEGLKLIDPYISKDLQMV